jgi:acyl carrier protein
METLTDKLPAMKQNQTLINQINGLLAEAFEVDLNEIQPEASIRQILDLDSLDYIDLVVVIENNFSFKVKPEDFIHINSFNDFYAYIISRIQTKEISDAVMAGQVQG